MTFEEAEHKFSILRQLYAEGKMSAEQFTAGVANLRLVGPDGATWQIDQNTGNWLRWNGASWEFRPRPVMQRPAMPPPPPIQQPVMHQVAVHPQPIQQQRPVSKPKRTAAQKISSFIIGRIFLAALSYGAAWVFHTWLLVYVNDGYNVDTKVSAWINVSGNSSSAFTIWFFGFGFVWSFLVAFFTAGPAKAFQSLFSAPVRLSNVLLGSMPFGFAAFAIGVGLMLLISAGSELTTSASLTAGVVWFFLGAGYPGLVLANGIRKFVNMFKTDKTTPSVFDLDTSHALVMGFSIGFLLSVVLGGASQVLGSLLFIGGFVLLIASGFSRKRIPQVAVFILSGLFIAGVFALIDLLLPHHAHADDGGWKEFKQMNPDGDLQDWLNDGASKTAMDHSGVPAAGAGAGAFLPGNTNKELPPDIRSALETAGQALIDHIRNGGKLPEFPIMTAGFGGATAAASHTPPPTLREVTEAIKKATDYFSGKEGKPVNWPNINDYTGKGRWTRAIVIGLIAASLPYAAGLSALWVVGTGVAAAAADKYGPDATEITEMFVGTSDE